MDDVKRRLWHIYIDANFLKCQRVAKHANAKIWLMTYNMDSLPSSDQPFTQLTILAKNHFGLEIWCKWPNLKFGLSWVSICIILLIPCLAHLLHTFHITFTKGWVSEREYANTTVDCLLTSANSYQDPPLWSVNFISWVTSCVRFLEEPQTAFPCPWHGCLI